MGISSNHLEALFADWLREHRGILVKVARSFAADATGQSELLQELMFQLWRSMPRFRSEAKPSTWIYRVCLNAALTWQRTERRRDYLLSPLGELPEPACPTLPPAERHEQTETLGALYAAVRALPAAERSLVLLLLDGLSYREIGEITGLTENHVGVALTRARKKLAETLKEVRHEH